MKKLLGFCAFLALAFELSAKSSKIVGFDIGLSSGLPVYSDSAVSDSNELVNDGDFNRVIAGGLFDFSFRLCEPLKLLLGADLLCDFIWSGSDYSNHLDYAFWSGIKAYPGIGGLNCSVAYALGRRSDFRNNDADDSIISSSSWGNGFRLGVEYDFLYGSSRTCMPALGFYYRFMPRGNDTYDNVFSVYISIVR